MEVLCQDIKDYFENLEEVNHRETFDRFVEIFYQLLERSILRVVTFDLAGQVVIHSWIQEAILKIFKHTQAKMIEGYPYSHDKIPLRRPEEVRCVPGAFIRRGSFIGKGAILMPSFVNIGAWVGEGTMIDTWSTVGSCAHIGQHCHISGGVGIGGVLEPIGARPVVIEDHVFIGARSEIAEGVRVGHHSVLASGVFLTASTKIYDRMTQQITYGFIPPYSVVVPGQLSIDHQASLSCVVIVKKRDEKTSAKVALNDELRS